MGRKIIFGLIAISFVLGSGCAQAQKSEDKTSLSAAEFAQKIKEIPDAPILDVRTPDEFEGGHLENAVNIDWNGSDFKERVAKMDKTSPVFVYCLSGGRSHAAAEYMRRQGFARIYEMKGGMMQWRAAGLPEVPGSKEKKPGMTKQQFDALLASDKPVLIDFYAEWCAPCKRMKPDIEEITTEMKDKVKVIRLNVDENPELCKELHIDSLPVVQLYKDGKLTWTKTGYTAKDEIVKQLK
jgi:thioredoxin